MSSIDLHIHSCYSSDGQFSPTELVQICQKYGVTTMAIADHNSVRGVVEGQQAANERGMTCIPAIEIDCTYAGTNLHVLGYYIDPFFPAFAEIEADILQKEQQASQLRMELVKKAGIMFNEEQVLRLSKDGMVIGETIAEVALKDPRGFKNPLLAPYRAGGARSESPFVNFYWDFCSQGKAAYVPMHYQSLKQTLDIIHQAGGAAVLAHPGNNVKEDLSLLDGILSCGFEGIEVFSSYHSTEQMVYYAREASRWGLSMTCGSDYHGKTKPKILPGCVQSPQSTDAILKPLFKAHQRYWQEGK